MADEITVNRDGFRVSNGQLSERWSKSNLKVDQSAARAAGFGFRSSGPERMKQSL